MQVGYTTRDARTGNSRDASNLRDSRATSGTLCKEPVHSSKTYFFIRIDSNKDGNAYNIRHPSNIRDISNMTKSDRDVSRSRDTSNSTTG